MSATEAIDVADDVEVLEAQLDELRERFDALDVEHRAAVEAGDNRDALADRLDPGSLVSRRRAVAERIVVTHERLTLRDPALALRYGALVQDAQRAIDIAAGGPALCALTGQPRYHLTDAGNGERFAEDHAGDLLHVPGAGWHAWDGRRYRPDDDGETDRRAKQTARLIREEARFLEDKELAEKVFKWATASESDNKLGAMVKRAQSERPMLARADDLDADPDLLCVQNATINLRTGEARPHSRADRITKLANVEHDPAADCPRWMAALDQWTDGDEEVTHYLQTAAGYSLTGHTNEQCLFLLEGAGANGKTTFIETLATLAGDYSVRADASSFTTSHKRGVRSDLARLRGARLVPAVEMEADARLAEVLVKQITGGDTIVASFLHKNEFEYRPTLKLWIAANSLPEVHGNDHAIWRRIRRVPFHNRIRKPDRRLPERLHDELPGILNWAVAGAVAWHRDGLQIPAAVDQATADYRGTQDTVSAFIAHCCTLDPDGRTSPSTLAAAYRTYCDDHALAPLNSRELNKALEDRLGAQARTKQGRFWPGIGLQTATGDKTPVTADDAVTTDADRNPSNHAGSREGVTG